GVLRFNYSAAAGVSEARDYYRLERYQDAIAAAGKTLGEWTDPRSNFARLLANRLPDREQWVHEDTDGQSQSRMDPSRTMAAEATRWAMRALVALAEERPQEGH